MLVVSWFVFLIALIGTFIISTVKFFKNQASKALGWLLIHYAVAQITIVITVVMYSSFLGQMITGR